MRGNEFPTCLPNEVLNHLSLDHPVLGQNRLGLSMVVLTHSPDCPSRHQPDGADSDDDIFILRKI